MLPTAITQIIGSVFAGAITKALSFKTFWIVVDGTESIGVRYVKDSVVIVYRDRDERDYEKMFRVFFSKKSKFCAIPSVHMDGLEELVNTLNEISGTIVEQNISFSDVFEA